jgi:NDP-sugar pyrophosphorylase family protein
MVLGAGLGSRLKPFTTRIPKPLIPVLGVPCIEFALTTLDDAGVSKVIVNTHAHSEMLQHYLNSHPVPGLELVESSEKELLLGSAGGFRKAAPLMAPGPFFSMNADVIHFVDLGELARAHHKARSEHGVVMTLILASAEVAQHQTGEYTEILTHPSTGLIEGFGPKKAKVPFYTGTAIFESEAFAHLPMGVPAEFVPEVLTPMIKAGKVAFIQSDALWLDVGSPELWAQAHRMLNRVFQNGGLPLSAELLLEQADPTCNGQFELTHNKIRLEDLEYEIKDIRNP